MATGDDRFWASADKRGPDECWLWKAFVHRDGYGVFMLRKSETPTRARRAHRYAWELTNGPIPQGLIICHRCDNPKCVNPAHLFLGTHKDNSQDREAKGRGADRRGVLHARALLTEQQVRDIRANYLLCRVTQAELGARFGVSRDCVNNIVNNRSWKHI